MYNGTLHRILANISHLLSKFFTLKGSKSIGKPQIFLDPRNVHCEQEWFLFENSIRSEQDQKSSHYITSKRYGLTEDVTFLEISETIVAAELEGNVTIIKPGNNYLRKNNKEFLTSSRLPHENQFLSSNIKERYQSWPLLFL